MSSERGRRLSVALCRDLPSSRIPPRAWDHENTRIKRYPLPSSLRVPCCDRAFLGVVARRGYSSDSSPYPEKHSATGILLHLSHDTGSNLAWTTEGGLQDTTSPLPHPARSLNPNPSFWAYRAFQNHYIQKALDRGIFLACFAQFYSKSGSPKLPCLDAFSSSLLSSEPSYPPFKTGQKPYTSIHTLLKTSKSSLQVGLKAYINQFENGSFS